MVFGLNYLDDPHEALLVLVGMGQGFLKTYYGALGKDIGVHEQAVLLVVAIVLLSTVNRVPGLLGSLANGPGAHHVLGAGGGAAMSAASTAGAMFAIAK